MKLEIRIISNNDVFKTSWGRAHHILEPTHPLHTPPHAHPHTCAWPSGSWQPAPVVAPARALRPNVPMIPSMIRSGTRVAGRRGASEALSDVDRRALLADSPAVKATTGWSSRGREGGGPPDG